MEKGGWLWIVCGGVAVIAVAVTLVPALFVAAAFVGLGGGGSSASGAVPAGGCSSNVGTADEVTKEVQKELAQHPNQPPAVLVPVYRAAAAQYNLGDQGPSILASINYYETDFGTNRGNSSANAQGWMQFLPSSWTAYGVDADKNGVKDIQDPDDAIFAAANLLHASGAPGNWQSAIFSYNHAQWYVDEVVTRAKQYNIPAGGCS